MRMPEFLDTALRAMARKGWGAKARKAFYRRLAVLVRNGKTVAGAVRILEERARGRAKGWPYDPNVVALSQVASRLENGASLEAALAGWAPPADLAIIAAGSRAGDLPGSLEIALAAGDIVKRIRNSIISRTWEPLVMLAAILYLIYLIGHQVLPAMEMAIPEAKWPVSAQMMLPLAWISTGPPAVITVSLVATLSVITWITMGRWSRHGRRWFDRLPPWSIYRVIQGAGWIAGFSSLISAGERFESALTIQAKHAAPWLKDRLIAARVHILNGLDLGTALSRTGYAFPDQALIDDIGVFAHSADFPRVLKNIGEEWIRDQETQIQATVAVATTILNVGINLIMVVVVIGIDGLQNALTAMH